MKSFQVLAIPFALSIALAACGGAAAPASPAPPASSPAAPASAAKPAASAAAPASASPEPAVPASASRAASAAAPASGGAKQKITLRAAWTAKAEDAPIWLAIDRGYFDAEGLTADFQPGSGSGNTVQTVANKSDMFGYADSSVAARGISDTGTPVKVVMIVLQKNPIGIAARPEIKTPKDLVGKTLITTAASGPAQLFPVFAQGAGIDPTKVNIANVAASAQLSTFQAKKGDAVSIFINNEQQILDGQMPGLTYFKYADYGVKMLNSGWLAHNDTISQNPDLVKRFAKATLQGYRDMAKNPKDAADSFMKRNPTFDRGVLEKQIAATVALYHTDATASKPLGWVDDGDWTATLDALQKYVDMKNRLPNDRYYTNDFIPQLPA